MDESFLEYAQGIQSRQEVIDWLNTTGKKAVKLEKVNSSELEHIIDFLSSSAAPQRFLKMSIEDAKRKAKEWAERNQKKGKDLIDDESDIETIHVFKDKTKIVKLKSKKSYQREGFLMNHCLGGYDLKNDVHIYSYRDKENMPHATFEVQKESDEIVQIKGKGNGPIHPKYIHPILEFLKIIGMDIRPSDMKNLGYYHIHKDHLKFLKEYKNLEKQIAEVNGEYYAI